ncbi:hypothetical protein [Novosphingobium sp. BL-52-GroH]|uniref:hypothetical protein n=1 Tax=Novosphingobium sp. BL-52-GroH TaxID=3349877 RepID=UPI00384C2C7A
MIPILLDAGADIEGIDTKGHSALVLAAYHGLEETAALLLDRGADPNCAAASASPLMGGRLQGTSSHRQAAARRRCGPKPA